MSQELDALVAEVSEETAVMASAAKLLNGLKARLDQAIAELAAANIDNATLNSLSADLNTGGEALAAAVAANT